MRILFTFPLQSLVLVAAVLSTPILSNCTGDAAEELALEETENALFAADDLFDDVSIENDAVPLVSPDDVYITPEPLTRPVLDVGRLEPGYSIKRVVGVVDYNDPCPPGNNDWKTLPASSTTFVHGKKARFCVYRWAHATTPIPDNLPVYCPSSYRCCRHNACENGGIPGRYWVGPDDLGLRPSATPLEEAQKAISDAVGAQHRRAMGAPEIFPKGESHFAQLPSRTKVFVLDNSGLHGDAVANWIKFTACTDNDEPCGISMHKRNVFVESDGRGSVVVLAQAIEKAIDDAAGFPAVMNLSLELHPMRIASHGSLPNNETAFVNLKMAHLRLESALNKASCRGIPVIAAAGNFETGLWKEVYQGVPGNQYAANVAFPAAFGRVGMGRGLQCPNSAPDNRRLAYAAGAILYNGENAISTRIKGQTCLVAPSIGLTANTELPIEGTSFSAAAMTGAFATLSRYAPFANGHELMWILRDTADIVKDESDNEIPADACEYDQWGKWIKRINMCRAIHAALDLTCNSVKNHPDRKVYRFACDMVDPESCSTIDTGAKVPMGSGPGEALRKLTTVPEKPGQNKYYVTRTFEPLSKPLSSPCPGQLFADNGTTIKYLCPVYELSDGLQDSEHPRTSPGAYTCGGCSIAVDGAETWLVGTLTSDVVRSPTVSLGLIGTDQTFVLGDELVNNADGFAIKLSDESNAQDLAHASFSFQVEQEAMDDISYTMGLPVIEIPVMEQ